MSAGLTVLKNSVKETGRSKCLVKKIYGFTSSLLVRGEVEERFSRVALGSQGRRRSWVKGFAAEVS